ncbi:hypothetical protein B0T24DRAFT_596608 [Lasiosphaeria ovina]|uniref:Uncharacterized protein n=1 Tax=Lasiosphaeria ovina TaxID=92902 RepID=A0AAE0N0U5_9PEZI|nr:hypothetical protein B0T24DRAFT_596608 [Lasiosphaeria ovina]
MASNNALQVRGLAYSIMEEAEHRPWDALSAKTREKLLEIAPTTAKRFWGDDYDGFILIAAWLWRIITDVVLCNPHKYDTPVWEAFGTLDAAQSRRRAGTLDGAILPPPLAGAILPPLSNKTDERRHDGTLMSAVNAATNGFGNMESFILEYRYHQWRALTYGMLRHDEAVPHASPDRLARAIVEDVTAAFDFDQDFLDGILETSAAELAVLAVKIDNYILIARGNFMPTYRLPGRTEGDILGRPFYKSAALIRREGAGDQGDPIDMVVAPGIFTTGTQMDDAWTGDWVGAWFAPIQVCVDYFKGTPAESIPATSPEGGRGKSTAAPRTRKSVKAEAEEKDNTSPEGGRGKSTAAPRTRKSVKAEAEEKDNTSSEGGRGGSTAAPRTRKRVKAEAEEKDNTRAKGKAKPKAATKGKKK